MPLPVDVVAGELEADAATVDAAAVEAVADEVEAAADDDAEPCAKGEESTSCDSVTKSSWAADRLPFVRSLPSCLNALLNCSVLASRLSS